MTRTEAIAIIEKALPVADDATLAAAAELLQSAQSDESVLPRALTARELDLIEQSKADFAAGRTYSIDEARAQSDAFLGTLRAKYPTAP